MNQPVYFPEPPAPEVKKPKLWPRLLVAALTAALITGLVLLALSKNGGTAESSSAVGAIEAEFAVTGTFTLYDVGSYQSGGQCEGSGGYSDIRVGTQVRISDATGKILAIGALDWASHHPGECVFTFTVRGVPSGEDFYQIEVSHRGLLTYSETEMRDDLALSLGD